VEVCLQFTSTTICNIHFDSHALEEVLLDHFAPAPSPSRTALIEHLTIPAPHVLPAMLPEVSRNKKIPARQKLRSQNAIFSDGLKLV
jgi:hypothetical protein